MRRHVWIKSESLQAVINVMSRTLASDTDNLEPACITKDMLVEAGEEEVSEEK